MRKAMLLGLCAAVAGCTTHLPLAYEPKALTQKWVDAKPAILVGAVTDRSGGLRFGMGERGLAVTLLERPIEETVREALLAEFQVLGLEPPASAEKADARLSVAVTRVEDTWPMGFGSLVTGIVELALTFRDRSNRMTLYDATVQGKAQETIGASGFPGQAPQRTLQAALADAMGQVRQLFLTGEVAGRLGPAQAAPAAAVSLAVFSDVDTVPQLRRLGSRRGHAVVIGIEGYRRGLPPADYASADARLFASYLSQGLGFPQENVALLTDAGATKGELDKHFKSWLPNRVSAGDEVVVYFSGHGAPNPATGEAFLVPQDGDPTYLQDTAVSLNQLYAQLSRLPADRITVVLDSCFSGAGGRSLLAKGARPLVSVESASALPGKVTVLAASAGSQISNTFHAKGHGLFTYYLLKGVAEAGADAGWRQAFDFAGPKVRETARREYNAAQDPQWREGK